MSTLKTSKATFDLTLKFSQLAELENRWGGDLETTLDRMANMHRSVNLAATALEVMAGVSQQEAFAILDDAGLPAVVEAALMAVSEAFPQEEGDDAPGEPQAADSHGTG